MSRDDLKHYATANYSQDARRSDLRKSGKVTLVPMPFECFFPYMAEYALFFYLDRTCTRLFSRTETELQETPCNVTT